MGWSAQHNKGLPHEQNTIPGFMEAITRVRLAVPAGEYRHDTGPAGPSIFVRSLAKLNMIRQPGTGSALYRER